MASRVDWPFGMAVESAGNLYVGDEYNNAVQTYVPGLRVGTAMAIAVNILDDGYGYTGTPIIVIAPSYRDSSMRPWH
jgi:hypothetical protein